MALGFLAAALTPASLLFVKGDTFRTLGLILTGGFLLGSVAALMAPAADRLLMAHRCTAARAAFAGSATMKTQSNPLVSGVLWVVDDETGCEIGWEPARRAKRTGTQPVWIRNDEIEGIELGDGRSGELLIERTDGTTLEFSVTDLRRLHEALLATPLARSV